VIIGFEGKCRVVVLYMTGAAGAENETHTAGHDDRPAAWGVHYTAGTI